MATNHVEYERDRQTAELVSSRAYPVDVARAEVDRLQRSGIEASWALDHDDRSVAWIYRGEVQS